MNHNLQQNQADVLVFRLKRNRDQSEQELSTINFIGQPKKIKQITEKLLKNNFFPTQKQSQLFLKKIDCPQAQQQNCNTYTAQMNAKQYQFIQVDRKKKRDRIIAELRSNNQNIIDKNIQIIDIEIEEEKCKDMEQENEEDSDDDIYYTLQSRQVTKNSGEKSVQFPQQLMSYIDSDEQKQDSFSSDEIDSDCEEKVNCSLANQTWKQTVNGKQVEYMDQYSSFNSRFKTKKHNMN